MERVRDRHARTRVGPLFRWHLLSAFLLACLVLPACQLTDHTEHVEGEVTPALFPDGPSGYAETDSAALPRMLFDSTTIDMGRVSQGVLVERTFHFKNTGGNAVLIADVRGSCGCTVSKSWPREPVPPGGTGAIAVSFDSEGREGLQEKTITVVANTRPSTTVLMLRGEVIAPTKNH
ncbi:MAG: DUF1573 domain-containing protein [Flavobacteriales bacterium]|nr:DUF1573 domain-containing protein [Flavobacteriales bacterium]MBK6752146.1 DUF1573 domain-containing protein [Flavobacteriales bacterium]MBK7086321.1 DUF1573 domain-containing protein [Flavobacteriales bacterium]MBK7269050.1 DUF1573 domain-containing protein [Flavobacteriales bacterium]MBK7752396.1 DUF1573 domain-containing protein [Flavobacteriales bacterium]